MREQNRLIGLIAWMFAITATVWCFTIPIGEAPDEREHLQYAGFIREHGRLPTAADRLRDQLHEGFQAPLYHVILGGWGAVIGFNEHRITWIENPVFDRTSFPGRANQFDHGLMYRANAVPDLFRYRLMRLPGVLFGTLAIWLVLRSAALIGSIGTGGTLAVIFASTPFFAFTAGTIGNDMPAAMFGALAVFGWIRVHADRRWIWLTTLALALGLATKVTVLFLWLALAALAWLMFPRFKPTRERIILTLIPLPFAVWGVARMLFMGERYQDPARAGNLGAGIGDWIASWATTAAKTLYHSSTTAIGVVGVHSVWLPGFVYGILLAVGVVSVWYWLRSVRQDRSEVWKLAVAGGLSTLLLFLAAVYWYREAGFSMHSRLYLPFIPAILVGMSAVPVVTAPAAARRAQTWLTVLLGTVLLVIGCLPGRFWTGFAYAMSNRLDLNKPVEHYAQVLSILYAAAGTFLIVFVAARRSWGWLTAQIQQRPMILLWVASLGFSANLLLLFLHVRWILS